MGTWDITGTIFTPATNTSIKFFELIGSNPYRWVSGGTIIGSGTTQVGTYTDAQTGMSSWELADSHYAFDVDFTDIADELSAVDFDYIVHMTMECGNDDLMGDSSTSGGSVPEPPLMALLGIALFGMAGIGGKKIRKKK